MTGVKYEAWEIADRVIWARFQNSYEMNITLLRFQEFYESPEFRNSLFSLEQYMDWYAYNEHKKDPKNPGRLGFDYLTRVEGMNIPCPYFVGFLEAIKRSHLHLLSDREQQFIEFPVVQDAIEAFETTGKEFIIIATYRTDVDEKGTLDHELAHAKFMLDPVYRTKAQSIVLANWCPKLHKVLKNRGYDKSVIMDEMHAYALVGWPKYFPWYKRSLSAYKMRRGLRTSLTLPETSQFFDGGD